MLNNISNYLTLWLEACPRLLFKKLFPEKIHARDYTWTRYSPLFQPAVRLINGQWAADGQLWRRRRESDSEWEYCQDAETDEEQCERIA